MSYTASVMEGYLPGARSSEATNTIPQFGVVCLDTTTEKGVVRPDSGNAGPVAGINESTGVTSAFVSGVGVALQPGNPARVATSNRIAKVLIANALNVAIGDKLYVTTASTGAVDSKTATSNKFVGTALQAVNGDGVTLCAVLLGCLRGV